MATSSASANDRIKHVTVIGGGLMGSGIAQVTAQAGFEVTLVDVSADALARARQSIATNLQRVAKRRFGDESAADMEEFVQTALKRLHTATDAVATVAAGTDLVIEAIVEKLGAKQELFRQIDKVASAHTLFTSNTSSLSIADIGSVTTRHDRFGGLHFFSPVPVMKLLEVIRTERTSDATFDTLLAFGRRIGKACVECKDTAGFIVNRLLLPSMAEAIRMYERGDASMRDIDASMKLGAGHPMGPFELADYVGLDIVHSVLHGWHEKEPENGLFRPMRVLDELVAAGKLGVKTGEGFYDYKH